jgi:hypothetical protein
MMAGRLIVFLFMSTSGFAQITVKKHTLMYASVDSVFYLSFDVPVIKGMEDKKQQNKINDAIRSTILYSDSLREATLIENRFQDPTLLDSLREIGNFPRSNMLVAGDIQLLTERYLCLRLTTGYNFWGAAHGSSQISFIWIDLRTFAELEFQLLFNEKCKRIMGEKIYQLLARGGERSEESTDDLFYKVTNLGISKDHYLLFFINGTGDGYGSPEYAIFMDDLKGCYDPESPLDHLLKAKNILVKID